VGYLDEFEDGPSFGGIESIEMAGLDREDSESGGFSGGISKVAGIVFCGLLHSPPHDFSLYPPQSVLDQ
jgi:hypothetical protein